MNNYEKSLLLHEENKGKWEMNSKVSLKSREDLSIAYTPGVARPCEKIHENPSDVYRYTSKGNTVAVVSDGSAVLGLGNIGAKAAIPVMEGKAVLFKGFADIDAVPICLDTQNDEEIISIVKNIAPTFGGINLEDIAAPRCFEIERRLQEMLDIPVFHDDQHGTAVVVSAAVINAMKVAGKNIEDINVVISGDGSAGTAIAKMLHNLGVNDILVCGLEGILSSEYPDLNAAKRELLKIVNKEDKNGKLKDALIGADVFIGVSAPKVLKPEYISFMNDRPAVFAMANPEPEIMPSEAKEAGAFIVGTGRSDFGNQINNVMAFPGIFRGALDAGAKRITEDMKVAAAYALAGFVKDENLCADKILPDAFEEGIAACVAEAVAEAWRKGNE